MKIEEFIPFGAENAITRADLSRKTNLSDRVIREHIEGARRNGVIIINLQDGNGYFRPTENDRELVRRQYLQQKSRAMKILSGNKAVAKWLKTIDGQMSFC